MDRANVPKFGNWENGGNDVPYTVYFDKARKNKVGGKMINPNDPLENPEMFAHLEPSSPTPPPKSSIGRGSVRPTPEQRDTDYRQFSNSSSARSERGRGQRPNAGSEQSFERSPLHPNYQAKVTGQGNGSPAWEGRRHDSSHATRSRLRPADQGDESPKKMAAVPKFGAWNESDPESAENFTHIFNKVREERNAGQLVNSFNPKQPSTTRPQPCDDEPKKPSSCFPKVVVESFCLLCLSLIEPSRRRRCRDYLIFSHLVCF